MTNDITADDIRGLDVYKYHILINLINNAIRALTKEPPEEYWTLEEVKQMSEEKRADCFMTMFTTLQLSIKLMEIAQRYDSRARSSHRSMCTTSKSSFLKDAFELTGVPFVWDALFGD